MPPALSMQVMLPHEYSYLLSRSTDEETTITRKRLAELIVEKYGDYAKSALWPLRQQRAAGIITFMGRTVLLQDGVGMRYSSNGGMEYVTLVVPPAATRNLLDQIKKENDQNLCLMVLHDGNKITAIPMDKLSKPKAVYTKSLDSNWGNDFFMSAQIRPSDQFSPVYSPLQFGAQITRQESYVLTWLGARKNTAPNTSFSQNYLTRAPIAFIPMLAANGSEVFTPFDMFQFAQTMTGSVSAPDATHAPWLITSDGRYCYGVQSETSFLNIGRGTAETRSLFYQAVTIGSWEINVPEKYKVHSDLDNLALSPYYMSDDAYKKIKDQVHPQDGPSPAIAVYYASAKSGLTLLASIKNSNETAKLDIPYNVATVSDQFTPTTTQTVECAIAPSSSTVTTTGHYIQNVDDGPNGNHYEVTPFSSTSEGNRRINVEIKNLPAFWELYTNSVTVSYDRKYVLAADRLHDCPPPPGFTDPDVHIEYLLSDEQYHAPFPDNVVSFCAIRFPDGSEYVDYDYPPGRTVICYCLTTGTFLPRSKSYTRGPWDQQQASDVPVEPYKSAHINSFPFAVNISGETKIYCSVESFDQNEDPPTRIGMTHYTPYGEFENKLDFIPWLHVDNGVHVIQGFGFGHAPDAPDKRHLYLDGQEYGSRLSEAIGADINQIQMVVMDVPLSRIKQFK